MKVAAIGDALGGRAACSKPRSLKLARPGRNSAIFFRSHPSHPASCRTAVPDGNAERAFPLPDCFEAAADQALPPLVRERDGASREMVAIDGGGLESVWLPHDYPRAARAAFPRAPEAYPGVLRGMADLLGRRHLGDMTGPSTHSGGCGDFL